MTPSRAGGVDNELIARMMARAEDLGRRSGSFYLDMHHRDDPVQAGVAIGLELLDQVGAPVDAFCAGFGTGALLTGVARALRERSPRTRVIALEPASSAVLSGGWPGTHRIEGLGYGFIPALIDRHRDALDEIAVVHEESARATARTLARVEGVFAGTSSGFNVAGAVALASRLGPGRVVATVW